MAYSVPPTFIAGNTLTAAQMNTYLRDNFKALGDPWAAYSPALSNWTLGNGTLTGSYIQVGKFVQFMISYTGGSTTTEAGNLVISLPVACNWAANTPIGIATYIDASAPATVQRGFVHRGGSSTIINCTTETSLINATTPWTWTTSDQILISGSYESA